VLASKALAIGALGDEFDESGPDVDAFAAGALAACVAPSQAAASNPAPPWPLICSSLRRELLGGVSSKRVLQGMQLGLASAAG
jgi:hypothetical protein